LRGFKRVHLAAGEMQTITFPLTGEALTYWDTANSRFALEAGTVSVMVGASSGDIRQTGSPCGKIGPVRGRWPGRIALVVVGIAAQSACEDGTPVQRGFGSHQILGLRDSTFVVYAAKDDLLIYETGYGSAAATYWSINSETGEVSSLGAT